MTSLESQILVKPDGASIAYRRTRGCRPDAPGIMFFGGFQSDMTGSKAAHLHHFAETQGFAFIRFDYQGHGVSSGQIEEGGIETWRDDALAVFDQLTEGPQILVGSSMGSWIMQLVALARRDRVAGLLGIASAPDFTEELIWRELDPSLQRQLIEDGIARIPSPYDPNGYRLAFRHIEQGRRHLLLGAAIDLDCPVRLFHGSRDHEVPWTFSQRLLERLRSSDATLTLVKDGDHRLSAPVDLHRYETAILDLLESGSGKQGA